MRRSTCRCVPRTWTSGAALGMAAFVLVAFGLPRPAEALEAFDGRVQVHGFYRKETRVLSKNFGPGNDWFLAQLAHTLNLEVEADILDRPIGPIGRISGFARIEVRFDCIWADGCGIFNSRKYFGDDSRSRDLDLMIDQGGDATMLHAPTDVLTDGTGRTKTGILDIPGEVPSRAHEGNELIPFFRAPSFDPLFDIAGEELASENLRRLFQGSLDVVPLIASKKITGGFEERTFTLGPFNRNAEVDSLGKLKNKPSSVIGLPFRPALPQPGTVGTDKDDTIQGLWAPHPALRDKIDEIDDRGQGFNFSEDELIWDFGAGQADEKNLKELYLDIEAFQGRLWLRVGKQTIVWGKTELFRNQDQWNPQDVGRASLPSLEESRLAMWALRGVWSFYDVGPFQDVRLEVATIVDDFQSIDAGTCGEPFSPFLVCAGSFGFFAHGITGGGLAGAVLPTDPWNDGDGIEIGARLEWRYGRFAFALTDFWGFRDIPFLNRFQGFERAVDPETGCPLDALGRPISPAPECGGVPIEVSEERSLNYNPMNRTLFEFACAASRGIAAEFVGPAVENECALDIFTSQTPLATIDFGAAELEFNVAGAFTQAMAGSGTGRFVVAALLNPDLAQPSIDFGALSAIARGFNFVFLNQDGFDGSGPPADSGALCTSPITPLAEAFGAPASCLSEQLTNEQEALIGCGPFYGTNCDIEGFDIFNTEASFLFQGFPMFEPGGPVATRNVGGEIVVLPGARGPGDPGYDPRVDGCVGPVSASLDPMGICDGSAELIDPRTGERFRSEGEALSFNALGLLAAAGSTFDEDCDPDDPITCSFVRGFFNLAAITRNDIRAGGNKRFGRRTFRWAGGGLATLEFNKRNILGFAVDFAEDWTKTNWSIEATWVNDELVGDNDSRTLHSESDIYNLTISFDRPTFVNFLNENRTFIFNSQHFIQYQADRGSPTLLSTATVVTGYFQDRLFTQLTAVHDFDSASGAIILNLTYRFSSNFSTTLGLAGFYGGPGLNRAAAFPIQLRNDGGDFKDRSSFSGLSILKDRDELSWQIRYTF